MDNQRCPASLAPATEITVKLGLILAGIVELCLVLSYPHTLLVLKKIQSGGRIMET